MKFSQTLLRVDVNDMTPTPNLSGASMSSKTPEKDLEDRLSLDMVPGSRFVQSWSKRV